MGEGRTARVPERPGHCVYTTTDIREAHLAHQLRRGGYLLHQIAPLIAQVRHARGIEPLEATLEEWRGLSVLAAASELSTYLEEARGHIPFASSAT